MTQPENQAENEPRIPDTEKRILQRYQGAEKIADDARPNSNRLKLMRTNVNQTMSIGSNISGELVPLSEAIVQCLIDQVQNADGLNAQFCLKPAAENQARTDCPCIIRISHAIFAARWLRS